MVTILVHCNFELNFNYASIFITIKYTFFCSDVRPTWVEIRLGHIIDLSVNFRVVCFSSR